MKIHAHYCNVTSKCACYLVSTYLTWTTAWRKKSQEFLISERNLAKKKSGLAAEPRPLRAMPSHYPSS